MKRFLSLVAVAAVAAGGVAPAAQASSVHFKSKSVAFSDLGMTLLATGSLAGLGNEDIRITLTAKADADTTCTNQGGTKAPGQNPADITIAGSQSIPASEIQNGNVDFSVETQAPGKPSWKAAGCPSKNWTADYTDLEFYSATIKVEQGGSVVLTKTFAL